MLAARAAWNGGANSAAAKSRATTSQTGSPGQATAATSAARARSHPSITVRRGSRSPSDASSGPRTTQGT
jgi:hypothetical protein